MSDRVSTCIPPPPLPYDADDRVDMMVNELIAKICAKDFENEYLRELGMFNGFSAIFDVTALFAHYKQLFEKEKVAQWVWRERLKQAFERAGHIIKVVQQNRWWPRRSTMTLELWFAAIEPYCHEPAPPMVSGKRAKEMVDKHLNDLVGSGVREIAVKLLRSSKNEISFKLSSLVRQKHLYNSVLIGWHPKFTLDAIAKELRRRRYTVIYDPIDAYSLRLSGHMIVRQGVWKSREY
jgi:hypothetical protein